MRYRHLTFGTQRIVESCGAGFGYVSSTILTILLCILIGAGGGYVQVALISWIQTRVSPAMIGRLMSIVMFISIGMTSASATITGYFLKQFPLTALFVASGLGIAAVALGASCRREIRSIDTTSVQPASTQQTALAGSDR